METKKNILIINDVVGYGKVATNAMLPIISYMGFSPYTLPTALVSNTLDYGHFTLMETTDYMERAFKVWRELGFGYDCIATGFIASERQARLVSAYCREWEARGTRVFVDPIMGDEGHFYNGVTAERVRSMREMVAVAGLISPNYTEACMLTDTPYHPSGTDAEGARRLVDALRLTGAQSVVVTSIRVDGQPSVSGYDAACDEHFTLGYDEIPVRFPGTGDMFSAIMLGHLMAGETLSAATRKAMDGIRTLIDLNKDNPDKNKGIPVENFLHLLDSPRGAADGIRK